MADIIAINDKWFPLVNHPNLTGGLITVLTRGSKGDDCAAYCGVACQHDYDGTVEGLEGLAATVAESGRKIPEAMARAIWPELRGLTYRN